MLRPGGRLYATTNADHHLKEFWDTVNAVSHDEVVMTASRSFGVENGSEQLAEHFADVALEHYEDSLVVPEAQPLIDYAQSTGFLDDEQLLVLRGIYEDLLREGPIHVQTGGGLFVATKKATQ